MRNVSICILGLLLFAGCSSNSFLGSRFNNFSAYYNKYYNAKRSLAEGVRGFEEKLDQQPIDQDIFLSLFGRSDQASTQRKPFEDAITKSSDILRKHPNSKWVDDAIMIIGKAWFFTLNFVGAEEKFNDILELDSPLRDEANFWLARTLIASGAYEDASTHLQAILSSEDLNRRWEPRYRLALAELYVQSENWEAASIELEAGLSEIRDKDLAARAQFLEGQVLEQLQRFADAVVAYERVQRHRPSYELSYAAQFSAVRLLADYLDAEEAMIRLRRMERDDKNYDHRAQLAYLRGRVLIALGQYDDALAEYDELLYDPTAGGAQVRGQVHYALGTYYRDIVVDYPYAAAHFDTASKSIRTPARGQQTGRATTIALNPSPSAITDSEDQASTFGGFSKVLDRIVLMDSLLYLGTLDDSSFAEVVLELRERRAEELKKMEEEMRRQRSESAFRGNAPDVGARGQNGFVNAVEAGSEGEAGFLYHKDEMRMTQARQDFILIWGDRPLAPNWRRIAAIEAALAEAGEEGLENNLPQFTLSDSDMLPAVDVSAVPRTQEKFDQMLTDRANARYELANVLFLSINRPDSASVWYRMVIEEDSGEEVVQRAYYALAEVQQALGDTLAANRLYELIISNHQESDLTDQAYIRLGRSVPDRASSDSLALAENAYEYYQMKWQEGVDKGIISSLFNLGLDWPNTPVAPRAFLASGKAYLEWAAKDSLDVLSALPVSADESQLEAAGFYAGLDSTATAKDSLITLPKVLRHIQRSFATSLQAPRATRMLTALEEERARRQAITDSLQFIADSIATQLAIADSIANLNVDSLMQSVATNSTGFIDGVNSDSLQSITTGSDSLDVQIAADFHEESDSSSLYQPEDSLSEYSVVYDSTRKEISMEASAVSDSLVVVPPPESLPVQRPEFGLTDEHEVQIEPEGISESRDEITGELPDQPAQKSNNDPSLGNIDWSQGGYTIYLVSYDDREMAKNFINYFGRTLSGVQDNMDIYGAEVQNGIEFRVGLGLFGTLQEAEALMQQLAGKIPDGARVTRIRGGSQ